MSRERDGKVAIVTGLPPAETIEIAERRSNRTSPDSARGKE
jgi:hypothetical protein